MATVLDPANGSGASIDGFVTVSYVFSVSGVTNGTASFDLTANGTLTGNAIEELEYPVGETVYINGVLTPQPSTAASLASGSSVVLIDSPITNGTTMLNLTLFYNVTCILCGESSADFLDPVSITGASAFDANGDPVTASFVSESGFNPNAPAVVPTPEPSSLVLLGTGLLGVAAGVRRRLAA